MKKVALVFVLAVFVPSLVLAWLAVRSLRDQQFLLERQQSLLYQGVADALAAKVQEALAEQQHAFALKVTALLRDGDVRAVARSFDSRLCQDWPLAKVGFAVTTAGELLSPSSQGRTEARAFYADNGRFLANRESAEVYLNYKQAFNNASAFSPLPQSSWPAKADLDLDSSRQSRASTAPNTGNAPSPPPGLDSQSAGNTRDGERPIPQASSALLNNTPDQGIASGQNSMTLYDGNTFSNRRSGYNQKVELRNVFPQRQSEVFQNSLPQRNKPQQSTRVTAPPFGQCSRAAPRPGSNRSQRSVRPAVPNAAVAQRPPPAAARRSPRLLSCGRRPAATLQDRPVRSGIPPAYRRRE